VQILRADASRAILPVAATNTPMEEEFAMSDAERSNSSRIGGANRQQYNQGQHIFREGEVGDSAFIVFGGNVSIYRLTEEGEEILATLAKGALFGEMALIDDDVRMASAKAVDGPAEVLMVSRVMFQKKMDGLDPFTRGLIKILVDNVRNAQKQ
jgi:CRP/FNR family cyclic AMP-dependent transcriptional regulator